MVKLPRLERVVRSCSSTHHSLLSLEPNCLWNTFIGKSSLYWPGNLLWTMKQPEKPKKNHDYEPHPVTAHNSLSLCNRYPLQQPVLGSPFLPRTLISVASLELLYLSHVSFGEIKLVSPGNSSYSEPSPSLGFSIFVKLQGLHWLYLHVERQVFDILLCSSWDNGLVSLLSLDLGP